MSQPKTQKMELKLNDRFNFPKTLLETRMELKPNQVDVMVMLLAEIGKETDVDSQRHYTLTARQFKVLKNYKHLSDAKDVMKMDVVGESDKRTGLHELHYLIGEDEEDMTMYNFFSSVRYFNGSIILAVSPEVKEQLVALKKNDEFKIWSSLQYLLPLKSTYTKQIYLMCRNFVLSGIRYPENWESFKERLEVPKSYSLSMIKSRILDKAKEDINATTDLFIDYTLKEVSVKGGKKVESISFKISKKAKNLTIEQKTVIERKLKETDWDSQIEGQMYITDYPEYMPEEHPKPKGKKTKFSNFPERNYDMSELEKSLIKNSTCQTEKTTYCNKENE